MEIGRNYQLFRYMLALNAKGTWPTKFNGGLLTVDPVYTDTAYSHLPPISATGVEDCIPCKTNGSSIIP